MAIPLGWMQLKHQKVRFAVALSGIAFAVILILMQLGFQAALFDSAVRYQEQLDYDIALFSKESSFIANPRPFSLRRLYQARAVEGVASVSPLYLGIASWKNPWNHEVRNTFALGVRATERGYKVRFITAADLVLQLEKARREAEKDRAKLLADQGDDANHAQEKSVEVRRT